MLGFGPRKGRRRSTFRIALNGLLERIAAGLRQCLPGAGILAVACAAVWGLQAAESRAHLRLDQQQLTRVEMVSVPGEIQDYIAADIGRLPDMPWGDENLCRRIYGQLRGCAWLRSIIRVTRGEPGVVTVSCDYRRPAALIQHGEYFYLTDEYGVRLPGHYLYHPGYLLIQGVQEPPPQPGEVWPGADLTAGLRLAVLLDRQPYRHQIAAISVHNYDGRLDPYSSHIELITDRGAGRILWGSAPGEEFEENSAAQKLHILSENFRGHGRIDAYHPMIDVSVFPDRFLIPA